MSSGSSGDPQCVCVALDERKKRRMVSNRESAKRSRMRKQQHLEKLVNQVAQLQKDNNDILQRINASSLVYVNVESENTVLRARMAELSDRFKSLSSVLRIVEEASGFSLDIPEMPDPLLKPWQLPCPFHPIPASSGMFQF